MNTPTQPGQNIMGMRVVQVCDVVWRALCFLTCMCYNTQHLNMVELEPVQVRTIVAAAIIVVGLALSLGSLGLQKRKLWFIMLIVGVLVLFTGIAVTQVDPSAFAKASASPGPSGPPLKSILKKPEAISLAEVAASPSLGVTWSDGEDDDQPLETVVEFEGAESPQSVSPMNRKAHKRKAHAPKPVPAVPLRRRMDATVPGYAPAFAADAPPVGESFTPAPLPPSAGPTYYKPPYKYRTVNQIAEERAQFMQRPDTPELDRHRRVGQLREYGLAIPITAQKDGVMVPLTAPVQTPCEPVQ